MSESALNFVDTNTQVNRNVSAATTVVEEGQCQLDSVTIANRNVTSLVYRFLHESVRRDDQCCGLETQCGRQLKET